MTLYGTYAIILVMKRKQLTQSETLFDDDMFVEKAPVEDEMLDSQLEYIVDTQGVSYDQARRMLGLETVQYVAHEVESESLAVEPSDGVSVELGVRALALSNIMATYNQLNKTMGANISSYYPNNDIDARYISPDVMRERMGKKAASMLHDNEADLNNLNATKELIAVGYEPKQVEIQRRKIGKDLLDRYGPGKVYSPVRKKVVQKAQRTANRVAVTVKKQQDM